tara:strand:+ start:5446 stop:5877 length:432 start_codon:yes stop_codon:yes gene_type:complete
MNKKQKEQLDKLIRGNDQYVNNTTDIQQHKNSILIKNDLNFFLRYKNNNNVLNIEYLKEKCHFIYSNFNEIFKKITTEDNFDFTILYKLINILQDIENGKYDQNEGSFHVGNLLKQIYIDPVISDKPNNYKDISWNDYKNKYT